MTVPEESGLFHQLRQQLADGDDHLTAVEAHGLLCAMAIHPAPPENWQQLVAMDGQPLSDETTALLVRERQRLASRLGAGEPIQLPCRLDPFEEREGDDLTGWCTGFMAGVLATEGDWEPATESGEDMTTLLLPFLLISGLDEDPELDALWRDEKLVRQMARGLPELLQDLFLHLQAPELKD